jgi:peptide/nickel transport system substrate-binding protein
VVGGALLTACGQAASPEATKAPEAGQPEEQPTATTKSERQKPSWPMGEVPRNRTLIYQYGAPAAGNFGAFSSGYNHQIANAILYEPAAFYGAHADKTYMWLAESYQNNDTATEFTITFRKGIKWSDGTPFTAKDVVWSMETLKRVAGLNRGGTYITELEKAEAVDDVTLKVTLNQPDFRFFFKSLTFRFDLGDDTAIQPSHVFSQVADEELINQRFWDVEKGWPVTTSPYGVSASTEQYTNYDLRDSWWAVETGLVEKMPDVWRILHQTFTSDTLQPSS